MIPNGRYTSEFIRHKCGRTISIHGEKCLCEMRGFMEKTTPTMRSLRRLLRRAKAHGHAPLFVKHDVPYAVAIFAGRHIRVRDDGSFVQDLLPRWVGEDRRCDPYWPIAAHSRWHAEDMNHAAYCRKMRWYPEARQSIMNARSIRENADV